MAETDKPEVKKPLRHVGVTSRKGKSRVTRLHRSQRLTATARRQTAWDLYVKCASCRKVGQQLGVSAMQISRDLRLATAEHNRLTARTIDEHRTVEGARLDDLQLNLATAVVKGDVPAIREARKLSESRRKLFGVDMPTRTEVTGADGGALRIENRTLLATLSLEEIQAKMVEAQQVLAEAPQALPVVPEIPPTDPTAAYAAALKARGGNGNGGG